MDAALQDALKARASTKKISAEDLAKKEADLAAKQLAAIKEGIESEKANPE